MKWFKGTMSEIIAVSETLQWLENKAVEFGIPEKDITLTNSWQKVDKVVRDWQKAQTKAQELGYASLPVALKALAQLKNKGGFDIANLPVAFHKPPMIWLTGKPPSKLSEGFPPMRPKDAERQHRVILPLLLEAWELAKDDEETKEKIESGYRNWSASVFERELYTFIYDLEEPTLEEQFAEQQSQRAVRFEEWQDKNAKARAKGERRDG